MKNLIYWIIPLIPITILGLANTFFEMYLTEH